jgi:lipoprotein NlpI
MATTDDSRQQRQAPTCNDYRAEMILLGLRRRLQCEDLDEQQRGQLLEEIGTMEKSLGLR